MIEQKANVNNPEQPGKAVTPEPNAGVLGDHPVGVSAGAIGVGAAAGAAGGMIAGPIGAVTGAAVGAIVGGLAGKATAEAVNPTVETKHWIETHPTMPYASSNTSYEEFGPAYRYGWESFERSGREGNSFESVEADLGRGWDNAKGASRLAWDQAKSATRSAWDRVKSAAHGTTPAVR